MTDSNKESVENNPLTSSLRDLLKFAHLVQARIVKLHYDSWVGPDLEPLMIFVVRGGVECADVDAVIKELEIRWDAKDDLVSREEA
ncbi:hypothetical protein [Vacuolonema iberomarrocanum]|uniref:hypothetical protein n=1 Tax=Vacuolonema iberomarrocanum TaxID=3454632 RepID=UPI001A0159A7|nr:hypothetical protein [filamentous cyanobacterium LEGE 07170]